MLTIDTVAESLYNYQELKKNLSKSEVYCKCKDFSNTVENEVYKESKTHNFALMTVLNSLSLTPDDRLQYSIEKCVNLARRSIILYSDNKGESYLPSEAILKAFKTFQNEKALLVKDSEYRNYQAAKKICQLQVHALKANCVYPAGIVDRVTCKYGLTPQTMYKIFQWSIEN